MADLVFYFNTQLPCAAFKILEATIHEHGEHEITSVFDEFRVDQYVLADSSTSRIVALDFDNTITADTEFYIQLIQALRREDWEPIVCTLRDSASENLQEIHGRLQDEGIRVYTTDGCKKRAFMLHQGISVALWIDDYFPGITQFGTALLTKNGIKY